MGRKLAAVGLVLAAGWLAWWVVAEETGETVAEAPADPLPARIRAGAEASARALLIGDDARVVALTYPRVVGQLGGPEAMLEIMATGRRYMQEQGIELVSYTVETVSEVYRAGEELHAVVRTILKLRVPGGRMTQPAFLLAVSGDGGATWSYVDGAQLSAETVLEVVPAFNSALELPTLLEPTLDPDPAEESPPDSSPDPGPGS